MTISLPTMLFITFGTWAVEWFSASVLEGRYFEVLGRFIVASVGICLALTAVVITLKWITMGRYEPMIKPMWSWWAMRTEAVAVIYCGMAGKVLLDHLRGTPFLPWLMRLFGTKFGRGVYMDMTDITEFDCVSVGDFAALNALCALQTHLYEDRVMKVGQSLGRQGRDRRRGLHGSLRHVRRRLCAARASNPRDEGRTNSGPFRMGWGSSGAEGRSGANYRKSRRLDVCRGSPLSIAVRNLGRAREFGQDPAPTEAAFRFSLIGKA